ncbi:hypothetical protein V5799_015548 [Amblyomma americanum]|uniref:Gustatory receptor n=1 Tax=Amblyomma americanum TaxID=6943 RepID=A0AAQ4F7G3_AMBAM
MTSAHGALKFMSNTWRSIEPLRKRRRPPKFTGECVMVKRFSRYAKLFALVGCFFIRDFRGQSSEKESRVMWRSPYFVYSAVCFTLMLTLEAWAVYVRFSHLDFTTMFTEYLLSTLQLCLVFKVTVNFFCMTVASTRLHQFFRRATLFEASAGISYLVRLPPATCTWFRKLRKVGVAVTALTTLAGSLTFAVQIFLKASKFSFTSEVAKMVLRILSQVVFCTYELSMYIVLSTASEVLVCYVRSLAMALRKCEKCIREARIDGQSAAQVVENIRKSLCSVRELKNCIGGIWAPGIVAFSLLTLWVHCTTLYCLFIGHGNHLDLWLGLAYGAHCALALLDLAVLSHDLRTEQHLLSAVLERYRFKGSALCSAQNIRNVATRATILHSDDAYIRQIQFLHDSIDPDGMRLSAANFFCLDRGLLVSMAGSVITYTVILVQTSDGFSSRLSGDSGIATP